MNKIIISADSTCDISPALKEQYGFHIVPLYVNLGDDSFQDGVTITPEDIYAFVAANKQLPKTAAATIPDYVEAFSQFTKEGYDVIHFNISASMSVTHHNATLAAEEVEGEGKVYVVDSANLSTGTALLMLDAYDMKEAGRAPRRSLPRSKSGFRWYGPALWSIPWIISRWAVVAPRWR